MTLDTNVMSWEQAVSALRNDPDKQALVKGSYYDDPLISAADRYYKSDEWTNIEAILPSGSAEVLDVGAGRGIASYAFAKAGHHVTALEPDDSSIVGANAIRTLASQYELDIKVEENFSETLPFRDNTFEVVFARAVLHHTKNLDSACKEFRRVLKPGGMLIAIREHVISKPEDLDAFFDIHPLHKLYGGENAFLLEEYLRAISDAGFTIENVIKPFDSPINFHPYTWDTLRDEFASMIGRRAPLSALIRWTLRSERVFRAFLSLVAMFDNRPGRLYSFIAYKR